jgi:hypothetical protein
MFVPLQSVQPRRAWECLVVPCDEENRSGCVCAGETPEVGQRFLWCVSCERQVMTSYGEECDTSEVRVVVHRFKRATAARLNGFALCVSC